MIGHAPIFKGINQSLILISDVNLQIIKMCCVNITSISGQHLELFVVHKTSSK